MKNNNKWKKALLTLSALSLLASCQEQTIPSSSVSSPSSEDIVSSRDEMADYKALQTMLRNLSDGVSLESLVTTTATFGEGNSKQSQYYRFYLDVQNTKNEYAYQQYEGVDSASGTPNKDTLEASGDLTKNTMGYVCQKYLLVNNEVFLYPVTQETVQGTSYVNWADSGLANIFSQLNSTMFEKEDKDTYTLKSDVSIDFRRKISGNFYGANTLPAAAKFDLKVKDGQIYAYTLSTEVQQRYDSNYQTSYTLQYEFSGTVLAYGKANEEVTKNFHNPIKGKEDATFQKAFEKLQNHNYTETSTTYRLSNVSWNDKGSFSSKNKALYQENTLLKQTLNNKDQVQSEDAYYLTKDNNLQNIIKIGDKGYFNQGLALGYSNGQNPFPQFDVSSLFFKKEEEGLYSFTYGDTHCDIFNSANFTDVTTALVYFAKVDLRDENKITVSMIYAVSSSDAVVYYKLVTEYSNIGSTLSGIDISKVKDGDKLTWNDYFKDDADLEKAKAILGEERFNSLPVIGGIYNKVNLFVDEASKRIQFQYAFGPLSQFDFDGDSSLSAYEQTVMYAQVDSILRPYSQKLDKTLWPDLKAGLVGNKYCVELSSAQNYEEEGVSKRLTLDVYFTYDANAVNSYLVIDVKYDEMVTLTFDYNYEGAENTVQTVAKGSKVTFPSARRKGYRFLGWFKDPEGNEEADEGDPINSNTTYYAKWQAYEQ